MGLHVSLWDGDGYRHLATLGDTGPIAWKDVAIPLGRLSGGHVKLRLSSIADNWRIDHVALATASRSGNARVIPVASVRGADGQALPLIREKLQRADDEYVVTRPGEYMRLQFDVGGSREGAQRTWLLAAEGYYIEWMRAGWLETASATAFVPDAAAILTALELWAQRRDELRELFESTKVPIR
jgi:hypothetical protein